MNIAKNIPIDPSQNIQLELLGQCIAGYRKRRRYTRVQEVEKLAIEMYNKNGKGTTFNHLLSAGMASHKEQAQITLKHCLNKKILFTLSSHKPQQYYPSCLKSQISKTAISKNIPIEVTGVGCSKAPLSSTNELSEQSNDSLFVIQSLEGYILPLLPSAPLFIHKMHFKVKITLDCYAELGALSSDSRNKGKEHVEVIGNARVLYRFYANGTVMIFTESSNNPHRLLDVIDLSRLFAFFGQIRDRLVTFLADSHERIVPDIMEWELTQCDINKDVRISESLQLTGLKIQLKHLNHIFRIYIKSMGKDTVCRVEESFSSQNKSAVDTINYIFNPQERLEKQNEEISKKLDLLLSSLPNCSCTKNNNNTNANDSNAHFP